MEIRKWYFGLTRFEWLDGKFVRTKPDIEVEQQDTGSVRQHVLDTGSGSGKDNVMPGSTMDCLSGKEDLKMILGSVPLKCKFLVELSKLPFK